MIDLYHHQQYGTNTTTTTSATTTIVASITMTSATLRLTSTVIDILIHSSVVVNIYIK